MRVDALWWSRSKSPDFLARYTPFIRRPGRVPNLGKHTVNQQQRGFFFFSILNHPSTLCYQKPEKNIIDGSGTALACIAGGFESSAITTTWEKKMSAAATRQVPGSREQRKPYLAYHGNKGKICSKEQTEPAPTHQSAFISLSLPRPSLTRSTLAAC